MEKREDNSIVVEGRNVEEALQAACDMLDTTPNQVDYEVCESGRGGMLGFLKGKTYKIRVWEKSAAERMIRDLVAGLLKRVGFEAQFKVSRAEDAYEIDIETDGADGLLIGRGGETLTGLQHLISRMVGHKDDALRVRVDVAGYRRRRHEQLRRKARDLAERALSVGRDVVTEPLPADERRIIHLALADDGRVQTRALGEGAVKRVAVVPQARARNGEEPRGRTSRARPVRSRGTASRAGRAAPSSGGGSGSARRGVRGGERRTPGRGGSTWRRSEDSFERTEETSARGSRGRRRGDHPGRQRDLIPVLAPRSRDEEPPEDRLVGEREGEAPGGRGAGSSAKERRGPEQRDVERTSSEPRQREQGDTVERTGAESPEGARSRLWDMPDDSDAYFKLPDSVASGKSSEADERAAGAEASEDGEASEDTEETAEETRDPRPMTYGRRPQAGRRRRR